MSSLTSDLFTDIQNAIQGEIRNDLPSRILYSTDASLYQIEPLGVVFPRTVEDLGAAVEIAGRYGVPVIARGAGSSLAGQAVGKALVLDCSRHLTKIIQIQPEERTATVEPGVILSTLNRAAAKFGLQFGPDPATADRATAGGSVGNNATGAHSILYGMSADHIIAAETILSDGTRTTFQEIPLDEARQRAAGVDSHGYPTRAAVIYRTALDLRDGHAETIRKHFPRVWRRASGYNLNYLLPWSASAPPLWETANPGYPYPPVSPGMLNLAPLLAGSESTLGVMQRLTLRLVPKLPHTRLVVLSFNSIVDACDVIPEILASLPSAIELIPGELIRLARAVPAYAPLTDFVEGLPPALLAVEFAGSEASVRAQTARFLERSISKTNGAPIVAESAADQKRVWDVRKVGLGLFASLAGDAKPISFIEDLAVPVESLGEFVREMERNMQAHNTRANYYAHASAGCLHIRPLINLKSPQGVVDMRSIAEQAIDLTVRLGGAATGEHGDGIARSEWLEKAYGKEGLALFRSLKTAADPRGIFNPGRILDAPPMDAHLRYAAPYKNQTWNPVFDFSGQGDLAGAIEMCNGAGVCRKTDGVMCPSFQVTQNEMFATRGRANLLRAVVSNRYPENHHKEINQAAYVALDLCLACKGCKAECPSTVDMAKLKYEFMNQYYGSHPRKMRDFLFGYINLLAPLGSPFAPLLNAALAFPPVQKIMEQVFGLTSKRVFPHFAWLGERRAVSNAKGRKPDCLFLSDTFSRYFHPETERCGVEALQAAGLSVSILPLLGAGRTLISKGFLESAKRQASRLLAAIRAQDPQGVLPVIGVEPSEIFTLRDEFLDFFPHDPYVQALAKRAWMVDEFLLRPGPDGKPYLEKTLAVHGRRKTGRRVLLHGHCYQKAQPPAEDGLPSGAPATAAVLRAAGYDVEVVDSGCCGMAGAFGYEKEHYETSIQVGELALFPAVRASRNDDAIVAAAGTSCRSQIEDGTAVKAVHPITLI